MKALKKSIYAQYAVSTAFNEIILSSIDSYDGSKKKQLQSFIEDLQKGGCISGMISEFIYHADCKAFYVQHLDELENIKNEMEESQGCSIENRYNLPHYTFMCWLCFEEYCFDIYRSTFE